MARCPTNTKTIREKVRPFHRFISLILPYWRLFVISSIFMLLNAIFDGISLSALVPIADKILANKPIRFPYHLPPFLNNLVEAINSMDRVVLLHYIGIFVVSVYLIKGVVEFAYRYLMSDIAQRIIRDLRYKIYTKLQDVPMSFYSRYRAGDLIARITSDVGVIRHAISYGITELVYQGGQVLVFSTIIFMIDWRLAIWISLILPLVAIPVYRIGKMVKKLTHKGQSRIADINSLLYETILGAKIVKAFCAEEYEKERFNRCNQDYYRLIMKRIAKEILVSPLMEIFSAILAVGIFWYGGTLVLSGRLSFGVFALFLVSLLSMIRPIKRLSKIHLFFQQAIAAVERIYEILTAPSESEGVSITRPFSFNKSIRFEDVWFKYGDEWVLKGVSFEIPKGKVVGLVGFSGSGKSTIVSLLLRLYEPQKGRITIDGVDIKEFSLRDLREHIGWVSQDTILFNDTIANNIAYGRRDIRKEKIEWAGRISHIDKFVSALPRGYDTLLSDLGSNLSGGERQRIAIARAIVKDPPILLLDEATSQLDLKSEHKVQEALSEAMQGRTVLVIAHRLNTIKSADFILVLHEGQIVESGTHAELLSRRGIYYSLYRLQESGAIEVGQGNS